MRTTVTLDSDVAAKARDAVSKTGRSFEAVINDALRIGLERMALPRQFRTEPIAIGLRKGLSYDNIEELISAAEGEDHR
jgi:hypothetical protein